MKSKVRCCFLLAILCLTAASCSLKKKAVNTLADVLGEAEKVYLSDEDPELVGAALPFNLKTLETLLQSNPEHRGLLLTAAKSFVFYTYGFVEPEAYSLEGEDFERAMEVRRRAFRLYLRAYRYGLRGIEVKHVGFSSRVSIEPKVQSSRLELEDVPLAVWTAAALGSAVGASQQNAETTADIAVVGALLERALELDEDFEQGTIHEFLISYESQAFGGSTEAAQQHFRRALELGRGRRCGIWLSWAENISVANQDREEFEAMLERVLDFDLDTAPENRLLNTLAKRRARLLLEKIDELFL